MFGFPDTYKEEIPLCNGYNEDSPWQYLGWNLGRNADHTNIENTYPLGITPEPKDSKEGARTGVNKRSRRKEAHDDDSAGCNGRAGGGGGGWTAVTKGVARDARLKEAAGYIRAPIVRLFNNSRRVRVNSITTTSRSCRNL